MDYFIDHANYKDTEIYFPNVGVIALKRGQHIFGTRKIAEKLRVDRQRIRTKLTKLKNIGFLTLQPTHQYTIATVINYDTYQPSELEANPLTNQELTQAKPSPNPQLTRHNKDKKEKKVNNIPFAEIVNYLNAESGKNFLSTTKETRRAIRARWNEGFQLDDFKRVIFNKCDKWKSDEKMVDYLRPQTLFGTKFEGYLNESPPKESITPETAEERWIRLHGKK
jgi:uncharacterized phage protein (TIGR02220 family)